jgi:hypothetical protein
MTRHLVITLMLLLVAGNSAFAEGVYRYDINRSYSSGSSFVYPAPDGSRAQRVAGVEFIIAPHSLAPHLKTNTVYRGLCWGALHTSSTRVAAGNIYVIPSGEPLSKCWHKAPKSARENVRAHTTG